MAIKEHLVDVPTEIGVITFIHTSRKNRPSHLRKPYEYEISLENFQAFHAELKTLFKSLEDKKLQCALLEKKPLSKGFKLHYFLLGYRPGYCCDPEEGITQKEWQKLCKDIQEVFWKYLGKDAKVYSEKYTITDKFESRMTVYLAITP